MNKIFTINYIKLLFSIIGTIIVCLGVYYNNYVIAIFGSVVATININNNRE